MQDIADNIILPYRKKLMPKVVRFEGEFVATVDNGDWWKRSEVDLAKEPDGCSLGRRYRSRAEWGPAISKFTG